MASTPLRSASVFANSLIQDLAANPTLVESIKGDARQLQDRAAQAIEAADTEKQRVVQHAALEVDMDIYKKVVGALGATVVIAMLGILAISGYTIYKLGPTASATIAIPDGVVALASAAVGALAGLLSPLARGPS